MRRPFCPTRRQSVREIAGARAQRDLLDFAPSVVKRPIAVPMQGNHLPQSGVIGGPRRRNLHAGPLTLPSWGRGRVACMLLAFVGVCTTTRFASRPGADPGLTQVNQKRGHWSKTRRPPSGDLGRVPPTPTEAWASRPLGGSFVQCLHKAPSPCDSALTSGVSCRLVGPPCYEAREIARMPWDGPWHACFVLLGPHIIKEQFHHRRGPRETHCPRMVNHNRLQASHSVP